MNHDYTRRLRRRRSVLCRAMRTSLKNNEDGEDVRKMDNKEDKTIKTNNSSVTRKINTEEEEKKRKMTKKHKTATKRK